MGSGETGFELEMLPYRMTVDRALGGTAADTGASVGIGQNYANRHLHLEGDPSM